SRDPPPFRPVGVEKPRAYERGGAGGGLIFGLSKGRAIPTPSPSLAKLRAAFQAAGRREGALRLTPFPRPSRAGPSRRLAAVGARERAGPGGSRKPPPKEQPPRNLSGRRTARSGHSGKRPP